MDIANVGAFLGGASEGVGQGMDIYAKYGDMKAKNEQRQKQRDMEQFASELAKNGTFKTDPVGAMKQMGQKAAELGDMDMYSQYTKTADETQKAGAQKTGMLAYVASLTSPQDTAKHLNDYSQQMGMPNQFNAVTNSDGSITMLGMGADPKLGKRYASMQDLHNDTLMFLAPTMLDPEHLMEYEGKQNLQKAQTGLVGAQTGKAVAETETEDAQRDPKTGLINAQAGAAKANAVQSYASASLSGVEAGRIGKLLPGQLQAQGLENASRAQENQLNAGLMGPKISAANTDANAARRSEEEARITQPDRIAGVRAEVGKKITDMAYAGPKAEADLEQSRASAHSSRAYADTVGQSKRNDDLNTAIKPYVMKNELDMDYVPPVEGSEAELSNITSAIMDETKASARSAAGTTHEILANLKRVKQISVNKGTVTLADGSVRKVGSAAAQQIARLRGAGQ